MFSGPVGFVNPLDSIERRHIRMKIVFCVKELAGIAGGAERVLADIANGLASRGHRVHVLSLDEEEQVPFYSFSPEVTFLPLGHPRTGTFPAVSGFLRMKRRASDLHPDVIFGFLPSTYVFMAGLFWLTPQKFIACEHITRTWYHLRPLKYVAVIIAAFMSSKMSFLSAEIAREYRGITERKKIILQNPVQDFQKQANVMGDDKRHYTILSVGRLVEFKDHKTLIKAFAAVVTEFPKWRLKIIGTGVLRSDLDALIDSLSLNNVVGIFDHSDDIEADYANADLFVMPSRYEGFGLVTAEASSCGLPCVGFNDAAGTNSIIRHGENGILVKHNGDRAEALSSALRLLIKNPQEMRRLGQNGLSRPNWFELNTVLDHWEETIVATTDVSRH